MSNYDSKFIRKDDKPNKKNYKMSINEMKRYYRLKCNTCGNMYTSNCLAMIQNLDECNWCGNYVNPNQVLYSFNRRFWSDFEEHAEDHENFGDDVGLSSI